MIENVKIEGSGGLLSLISHGAASGFGYPRDSGRALTELLTRLCEATGLTPEELDVDSVASVEALDETPPVQASGDVVPITIVSPPIEEPVIEESPPVADEPVASPASIEAPW